MFDFIKKLFQKEKWELVTTITVDLTDNGIVVGEFYMHLSESNKGNRKVIATSTLNIGYIESRMESMRIYQSKVYRWLQGRHDPEIPRYNQIAEEDTANYLKGKI